MAWLFFHFYGYQDGNRWSPSRTWYYASVSHCKYGKPCDPLVSSFDFCPVFWYCICLAGCTGRLVRQFSDLILGTQEIMAGDKVTKEDE